MRILTEKSLLKIAKEAYTLGLNVGDDIGYQRRVMDEHNRGAIMPGYDMDHDLAEMGILKRKGW